MKKTPRYIFLTKGQVAIVDFDDYDWLNQWRWSYSNNGAAVRGFRSRKEGWQRTVQMHRQILGVEDVRGPMQVDHINGIKQDNRRCNLRLCTPAQNSRNTPARRRGRYKGVFWSKEKRKWVVQVAHKHRGYFQDELEAAKVADFYYRELYGEFARLNLGDGRG